jgi:hypothetical protein
MIHWEPKRIDQMDGQEKGKIQDGYYDDPQETGYEKPHVPH